MRPTISRRVGLVRRGWALAALRTLAATLALGAIVVGSGSAVAPRIALAQAPQTDAEALRSRIAVLAEAAERAEATEILEHARRALLASDRLRTTGDEAGAARAERIAQAAVRAAERKVEAQRARSDRDAARARVAELEDRARIAREALERARADRERRVHESTSAPVQSQPEAAPEGE